VTSADAASLTTLAGVHDLRREADRLHFDADADALPTVLAALAELRVEGLTVTPPSLEELFLRHYAAAESTR
jgi:ABC-2 type transport system ATP-binding protein